MSADIINEMRSVERWNLMVPLQVGKESSAEPIGDAVDISTQGIRILTDQPMPLNEPLRLWLQIPGQDNRWVKVPLEVEGAWNKVHGSHEIFETGFRFLQIEATTLRAVQSLIDDQMSCSCQPTPC